MDEKYSTKIFYSELVKAKFQPPISKAKWNTEFDISEKKEMRIYLFKQSKKCQRHILSRIQL